MDIKLYTKVTDHVNTGLQFLSGVLSIKEVITDGIFIGFHREWTVPLYTKFQNG